MRRPSISSRSSPFSAILTFAAVCALSACGGDEAESGIEETDASADASSSVTIITDSDAGPAGGNGDAGVDGSDSGPEAPDSSAGGDEADDAGTGDADANGEASDGGSVIESDAGEDAGTEEECMPLPLGSQPPHPNLTGEYSTVYPDGCPMTVTAWRVAQKKGIGDYAVLTRFKAFEVEGFDASVLYDTRIVEISAPETHKNVVLLAAGQKGPSGSGHSNGLTGQGLDWFDACGRARCEGIKLDGKALGLKLRALGWLPENETYMAFSLDNNFDYTMSETKRDAVLRGFVAWLKTKITADTERVILGGSSRGGCLSMLIAQALRADSAYDGIRIYVSSFDGVCKKESELGVTTTRIDNPLKSSYGGWATDLKSQFPRRDRLRIYHLAGGEEVVTISGVRAFSAYEGTTPPDKGTNIDWGWFKQTWVPWAHKEVGSAFIVPDEGDRPQAVADTIDAQLSWLKAGLDSEDAGDN